MRNPNIKYTLDDYTTALWVLDSRDLGHGEDVIIWAKEVHKWFQKLYALARKWVKSTRSWGQAIKAVYDQLKHKTMDNIYRTFIEQVVAVYRPANIYSAHGEPADLGLKMKIRKTKYRQVLDL